MEEIAWMTCPVLAQPIFLCNTFSCHICHLRCHYCSTEDISNMQFSQLEDFIVNSSNPQMFTIYCMPFCIIYIFLYPKRCMFLNKIHKRTIIEIHHLMKMFWWIKYKKGSGLKISKKYILFSWFIITIWESIGWNKYNPQDKLQDLKYYPSIGPFLHMQLN